MADNDHDSNAAPMSYPTNTATTTINPANSLEVDIAFTGNPATGGGAGLLQLNNGDMTAVWNDAATGEAFWIPPDMRAAMFIDPSAVAGVPGLNQDAADLVGGQTVGNLAGIDLNGPDTQSTMGSLAAFSLPDWKNINEWVSGILGPLGLRSQSAGDASGGSSPSPIGNVLGGIDYFPGISTDPSSIANTDPFAGLGPSK